MKSIKMTICVILANLSISYSQYNLPTTGTTSIVITNGTIFDDGGEFGNHSNNADGTLGIFLPFDLNHYRYRGKIEFNSFGLYSPDILIVNNGSISQTFTGTTLPQTIYFNLFITLKLISNSFIDAFGFKATISIDELYPFINEYFPYKFNIGNNNNNLIIDLKNANLNSNEDDCSKNKFIVSTLSSDISLRLVSNLNTIDGYVLNGQQFKFDIPNNVNLVGEYDIVLFPNSECPIHKEKAIKFTNNESPSLDMYRIEEFNKSDYYPSVKNTVAGRKSLVANIISNGQYKYVNSSNSCNSNTFYINTITSNLANSFVVKQRSIVYPLTILPFFDSPYINTAITTEFIPPITANPGFYDVVLNNGQSCELKCEKCYFIESANPTFRIYAQTTTISALGGTISAYLSTLSTTSWNYYYYETSNPGYLDAPTSTLNTGQGSKSGTFTFGENRLNVPVWYRLFYTNASGFLLNISQAGCNFKLNTNTINASGSSQNYNISVTSDFNWYVSNSNVPSWITLNTSTGVGNGNLSFTIIQNTGGSRSFVMDITNGSSIETLYINQSSAPSAILTLSPNILELTSISGIYNLSINSTNLWSLTSTIPSWIRISSTSGTGNSVINISVNSNNLGFRSTLLSFNSGVINSWIQINQNGNPNLPQTGSFSLTPFYVEREKSTKLSLFHPTLKFTNGENTSCSGLNSIYNLNQTTIIFKQNNNQISIDSLITSVIPQNNIKFSINPDLSYNQGLYDLIIGQNTLCPQTIAGALNILSNNPIGFSTNNIELPSVVNSSESFTIYTTGNWQITTSIPSWVTINTTSGVGNKNLSITATSDNNTNTYREFIFQFSNNNSTNYILVSQLPKPNLKVGKNTFLQGEKSYLPLVSDFITFGSNSDCAVSYPEYDKNDIYIVKNNSVIYPKYDNSSDASILAYFPYFEIPDIANLGNYDLILGSQSSCPISLTGIITINSVSGLFVTPKLIEILNSTLDTKLLNIYSSAGWTINKTSNWLQLSTTSGFGNSAITLTSDINNGVYRTGTLTITSGIQNFIVQISQLGNIPDVGIYPNQTNKGLNYAPTIIGRSNLKFQYDFNNSFNSNCNGTVFINFDNSDILLKNQINTITASGYGSFLVLPGLSPKFYIPSNAPTGNYDLIIGQGHNLCPFTCVGCVTINLNNQKEINVFQGTFKDIYINNLTTIEYYKSLNNLNKGESYNLIIEGKNLNFESGLGINDCNKGVVNIPSNFSNVIIKKQSEIYSFSTNDNSISSNHLVSNILIPLNATDGLYDVIVGLDTQCPFVCSRCLKIGNQPFNNTVIGVNTLVGNNTTTGTTIIVNEIKDNKFSLFPNPAKTELTIKTTQNKIMVIYNYLGVVVLTKTLENNETKLDISNLASGIYFVRVNEKVVKFLKE